MLTVIHKTNVPPGGQFTYIDPDSNVRLEHPFFAQLMENARQHRKVNNYPIGLKWNEEFEENVCRNTNAKICMDVTPMSAPEKLGRLVKALWNFTLSGFKTVDEKTLEERATICETCPHSGGEVSALHMACGKCGCTKVKLYLATEKCPLDKWKATA